MSGPSLVILGAVLFVLLCAILGVLVWQEAKRRPNTEQPDYVIDDAIRFISSRLDGATRQRLGVAGVRRVIEWEIFYLQGLAQKTRRNAVETVAGGSDASIDYIVGQIAEVNGATYDRGDVAEVLRLETHYLMSIGAVGEPVDPEENDEGGNKA